MASMKLPESLPRQIFLARALTGSIEILMLGIILFIEGAMLWDNPVAHAVFYSVLGVLIVSSLLRHSLRMKQAIYKWRCFKTMIPDLAMIVVVLSLIGHPVIMALLTALTIVYDLVKIFKKTGAGRWFIRRIVGTPEQSTAFSFIGMIAIGSVLLSLPRASADGNPIAFVDALFTATSAHCVTGLTVINTSLDQWARTDLKAFSSFGHVVILALIQIGGIGIMTLSAASIALLSGKLKPHDRKMADSNVGRDDSAISIVSMVRQIVIMTLAIEAVGAMSLFLRFQGLFPGDIGKAAWFSLFHAVSAFCNAGFSLYSNGLVRFLSDPLVNVTVMSLIILGGLGFPVISVLISRNTWSHGFRHGVSGLSIHAKLVLLMTAILVIGGAALLFATDYNGAQAGLSPGDRVWASMFQSVSARTAGFNTIDIGATAAPAVLVYVILMFIGAAPGGTGGGIKVTTFALLFLSVKASLRRRADIEVFNRSVHPRTLHNIIVITFLSLIGCFGTTFLLTWAQPGVTIDRALFESVSAFATCGLSMNLTPDLHVPGKLMITALMYLGRIGPLTLTLALARRAPVGVSYPQGKILVG